MTENYKEYIDSLIDEYPNAEKAFAYFCEQSNYPNMSEFLDDYGWNMEGLEEYVDVSDYKLGMDNLYADTIMKQRKKRGFMVKVLGSGMSEEKEEIPTVKKFRITFVDNGGMYYVDVEEGKVISAPANSDELFFGYFDPDNNILDGSYTANKNVTFTAKYSRIETATFTISAVKTVSDSTSFVINASLSKDIPQENAVQIEASINSQSGASKKSYSIFKAERIDLLGPSNTRSSATYSVNGNTFSPSASELLFSRYLEKILYSIDIEYRVDPV